MILGDEVVETVEAMGEGCPKVLPSEHLIPLIV